MRPQDPLHLRGGPGRVSPASARRPAPAPAASVRGVTCRAGGASAANPPARQARIHRSIVARDTAHRLAERPRMRPGGQLADQPARAAGWTAPGRRPPGSAGTGTAPPARPAPPACGPPQPLTWAPSSVKTAGNSSHRGSGSPRRRPEPARVGHPRRPATGPAAARTSPPRASSHRATAPTPGTSAAAAAAAATAATASATGDPAGAGSGGSVTSAGRQRREHLPHPLRPPRRTPAASPAPSRPGGPAAPRSPGARPRPPSPPAPRPITSPASARRGQAPRRQQHMRRPAAPAPRPARAPAPRPAPSSARHRPLPPRSPTRPAPRRTTGTPAPRPQLPFDHIPVTVYREHDASARQPSGPPRSPVAKRRNGRAAPIPT